MDKAIGAAARAAERFDIPAPLGAPRLTLTGARRLHIERHRGILEYGTEFISVNCGKKVLGVYGASLELASMSAGELLIIGDIHRIDFS
ncbi:MAG: YabP/YqfC family sporulation protein [Oscillospiraceae bacterium]|nr:YabP/YqfC family sporulation protein [Oscillospiraceae bacterium]MDR1329929.1 YabP/YqfC family sporulation protein [Oscillospiraceae bacterium]